jgi:hypothetical protein
MLRCSLASMMALCVVACLPDKTALKTSPLLGTWQGTYRIIRPGVLPDGSNPDQEFRFQLTVRAANGTVAGQFEPIGNSNAKRQDIRNYGRFANRDCFDVITIDNGDMRWCVVVSGEHFEGLWNRGPEGGPTTNGLGSDDHLAPVSAIKSK